MIIPIAEQRESDKYPVVTVMLIALNVLAFVGELIVGDDAVTGFCYVPAHPSLLTSFTAMFLHAGIWHLVGNMLFLWIVGPNIEEAFTPVGMLALYLSAGVFADFAHAHMIPADAMNTPTLGASGAIAGLMGASLVIFPRTKVKFFYWIFWFWSGTFDIDAFWAIGGWFLQQFILNLADAGGGVAYGAHIGGFGISAVVAIALVLVHVIEPHWERPESWPQRQRPIRPQSPQADVEARRAALAEQHMRTGRALAFVLLLVILAGGTFKGIVAYRAYRISQQVHYHIVVASDQLPSIQSQLQQVSGVTLAPHPHTSYRRSKLGSYWAGLEKVTETATDTQQNLQSLGYPAVLETVGQDSSVVHLQKKFPNSEAARRSAAVIQRRTRGVIELQPMQAFRITPVQDTMLEITVADADHAKPLQDVVAKQNMTLEQATTP